MAAPRPARILIVDDEIQTILALSVVLGQAGYDVCEAGNGAEALAALEARPADDPIDALLLDLHMPVLDGFGVLRRLDALGAELPVIVMTGYAASTLAGLSRRRGHLAVLHKPFSPDLVLPLVAEVLGGAAACRSQVVT